MALKEVVGILALKYRWVPRVQGLLQGLNPKPYTPPNPPKPPPNPVTPPKPPP